MSYLQTYLDTCELGMRSERAKVFCRWMDACIQHQVLPTSEPILHDVFTPSFHGSRILDLCNNPCNCNNMICGLASIMDDSDYWKQPASRFGSMLLGVKYGPCVHYVHGGEYPVSIYRFVNSIHRELHKPLEIFELDTTTLPPDTAALYDKYREMLCLTDVHYQWRTMGDMNRKYQWVDLIHGTTGSSGVPLTLKLTFRSQNVNCRHYFFA
ncbi:uncharacterized protein FOMMEDRAFT_154231 [Fomitiporia mediterranea MF3/22]|uniref:uncharacterized protein n=1 Tax=Fomitiporia mediterranea (strain MF3/22) TaxID=694068 RepID=UPI000440806D|nr:uncharacterized protein FOMMEDRAFT_154231 [Fomitiporia mediterranea MF3/22]EJD05061.1 hypothetical protein FOMMEDRAFT_154231 [Fomitiporia mediterranea MF3/22]